MATALTSFGEVLQKFRDRMLGPNGKPMSVTRLAETCGIDRSYYYKLQSDPNLKPSRELVTKLAQALQAPVDTFLLAAGYAPTGETAAVGQFDTVERLFAQYAERVEMPFYGEVGCGQVLELDAYHTETKLVPRHLARRGDSVVRALGYSMDQAGIYPYSTLIVKHQDYAENRQIVIANVRDVGCTCKRYVKREGRAYLVPESSIDQYYDIEVNEDVSIVGVVKATFYEREFA